MAFPLRAAESYRRIFATFAFRFDVFQRHFPLEIYAGKLDAGVNITGIIWK